MDIGIFKQEEGCINGIYVLLDKNSEILKNGKNIAKKANCYNNMFRLKGENRKEIYN